MVSLIALWLPILLSAVAVFIASSIIHMVLPWHTNDFKKFPAEDAVLNALRPFNFEPGQYVAPRPGSMKEMSSPEFQEKAKRGPRIMMTVLRQGNSIAGNLVQWFIYSIVVAAFAAYVAGITLGTGAEYLTVFRITSTVTFAAYALALWHNVIWYSAGVGATARQTIDGLVYALLTGGVFGWLWP